MSKVSLKKRWIAITVLCFVTSVALIVSFSFTLNKSVNTATKACKAPVSYNSGLYDSMHLKEKGLSRNAYYYGITGFDKLLNEGKLHNDSILSIVDFSLPSNQKRLFVINTKTGEIIFNTYVSHGRNSGKQMATDFSNEPNSFKSSLGFYVTGDTYKGQHGYSLKLFGTEDGINNNAFSRGIVMHSAWYVSEKIARKQGYIGRSQGCPALPVSVYKKVISKIKDGSCLFLYGADKTYTKTSKLIHPQMS